VRHRAASALVVLASLAAAPGAGATVRNFNVDAGHTSELRDATLTAPVGRKWIRRDLGGGRQPLVADGRVFVHRGRPAEGVAALARDTGATVWERDGPASEFAYGDGVLFYVTARRLMAVDAATGAPRWEGQLDYDGYTTGPPTVDGGVVYVGDGSTLRAFRASDGFELWGSSASGAAEGAPAVDADNVYSVSGCAETTALERMLGLQRWRYVGECTGGGGGTAMAHDGLVYAQDSGRDGVILDAASGQQRGTFTGFPSRAGDLLLLTTAEAIVAQDAAGRVAWRYVRPESYSFLPLTVGGIVWVVEGDVLVGLDAKTGGVVQRVEPVPYSSTGGYLPEAAPVGTDGEWLVISGENRVTGLAAGSDAAGIDDPDKPRGDEIVLRLTAPRSVVKGLSRGAVLSAERERTAAGSSSGTAELDHVELQADPFPYDERWEPMGRMEGWADQFEVDPIVNTRYRLLDLSTVPQAASPVVEIRVDFDVDFDLRAISRRTILASIVVDAPRSVELKGRRLYMYLLRKGARRVVRIRVLRLRPWKPRGRYRAKVRLPVRGLRRTDRLYVCFRNPLPDAVGPPVRGPDPCGRRRL
jgi:outer membrane protein assembly factor BamB